MSVFVVSLFLPYTVDFSELPAQEHRPDPPRRHASKADSIDKVDLLKLSAAMHNRRSSLDLTRKGSLFFNQTPPRTPAADAETQEFFAQLQPEIANHFLKGLEPRSLVRSDSQMPDWGAESKLFNQPVSKLQEMPSSRILGYGPPTTDEEALRARRQWKAPKGPSPRSKSKKRHHSRSASVEHKWDTNLKVVPAVQGNGGLANAVRAASESGDMGEIIWMGTVGFPTDSLPEHTKEEIAEKLESVYDAIPVYMSDDDFDGHYSHFCKTILWPVFHYQIPDHPKSKAYEDHSYKYYVKLNEAFADKIVASYKRGDTIWIHDYHLLLVPALVRAKLPEAKIGFFLHTAFPSSEVFRCLAQRNKLLEGMLGANMIGFQCAEYCEHFLTTTSRLLRVPATPEGIDMEDRFVDVTSIPIGIDPNSLAKARNDPEVADWIKVMGERYKGKHLIVARDRLDQVRGVRQKLLSYELFLNQNPEWKDKVVLLQVATKATDQEELSATVSDIVTRIDSQHSSLTHQPLVFLRQDIGFSQYLAMLSVADVLMITSLREGMSLTGHEYIVCQDGQMSDKKNGPIILSEFTGAASIFNGKELTINPWDYRQTAKSIKTALEMSEEEREARYSSISKVVYEKTGPYWMTELNARLEKAHEARNQRDTKSTPRLNFVQLKQKYDTSSLRLFIMDYEGTLANLNQPENLHINSPQRVLDALNDLLSSRRNIVYVMSGRMPEELDRIFARVHGLGLIAENGCFVRSHKTDDWRAYVDMEKMRQWKSDVKDTLKYYQDRMEGSKLEERHCSLILRYDGVTGQDQESAARLAGDCANHINDACSAQRIRAVPAEKCIVIEPLDYGKGFAAQKIFEENWGEKKSSVPDFVFVAGDDREDEAVFRWANDLDKEWDVSNVTTVSVGKKNTEAMATLTQGTSGLLSTLQKLSGMRR